MKNGAFYCVWQKFCEPDINGKMIVDYKLEKVVECCTDCVLTGKAFSPKESERSLTIFEKDLWTITDSYPKQKNVCHFCGRKIKH